MAFDGSGNLYAVNTGNNTIEKFTSGGVASQFASSNLSTPTFLAVSSGGAAAPEPTALLLLMPGVLGLVAARRSRMSAG